jgi:hypothetical protein
MCFVELPNGLDPLIQRELLDDLGGIISHPGIQIAYAILLLTPHKLAVIGMETLVNFSGDSRSLSEDRRPVADQASRLSWEPVIKLAPALKVMNQDSLISDKVVV